MRLWKNAKGDIITDEQVVAYVASHGSLSAALAAGDIELLSDTRDCAAYERPKGQGRVNHAKLATLL